MKELTVILQFIIFPGILFTAVAGLMTSWVDRKVTALVQMRVGPPFLQPFYDIGKLMIKETSKSMSRFLDARKRKVTKHELRNNLIGVGKIKYKIRSDARVGIGMLRGISVLSAD